MIELFVTIWCHRHQHASCWTEHEISWLSENPHAPCGCLWRQVEIRSTPQPAEEMCVCAIPIPSKGGCLRCGRSVRRGPAQPLDERDREIASLRAENARLREKIDEYALGNKED